MIIMTMCSIKKSCLNPMKILKFDKDKGVGEWLKRSHAVLGVDGSSLLTATHRCDVMNSLYA